MSKPQSASNRLASEVMYAAMTHLRDAGGSLRGSEVLDAVPTRISLDDWANEIIESNGLERWRTFAHFFSVDSVKAGFLTKSKGVWTLTDAGRKALEQGEAGYFSTAQAAYRAWRKNQTEKAEIPRPSCEPPNPKKVRRPRSSSMRCKSSCRPHWQRKFWSAFKPTRGNSSSDSSSTC